MAKQESSASRLAAAAGALSDPSRLRALLALRGGELCACQIVAILDLAPSTVSKHMAVLSRAGFVVARRAGRWVHYRLAARPAPAVRRAVSWVRATLAADPSLLRDEAKVRRLRRIGPEALCRAKARR